ncbi:MAG: hypothetical protein AAGF75_04610, partial [Cyanobacteria bacterium P01_H01_bin.130]
FPAAACSPTFPAAACSTRRQLAPQPALLNGQDLKQLGYRPGPQFRPILTHLRQATLDSTIQTRDQAIALVQTNYPLDPSRP